MTITRLFRTLDAALDAHLPTVTDEAARLEALTYHRGIKTMLATVVEYPPDAAPQPKDEGNVLDFEQRLLDRRVKAAVACQRRRQLAASRERLHDYLRHTVDDFGDPVYEDDIE